MGLIRRLLRFGALFLLSTPALAVDINQTFSPTLLQPTQITRVQIDLVNNVTSPATSVGLEDTLPADVFIATPANITSSCGGIVTATNSATAGTVNLTDGTVPARAGSTAGSCFIQFDAYASTAGTFINEIPVSTLTGAQNGSPVTNSQPAEATLAATIQNLTGEMRLAIGGNVLHGGETASRIITLANPNDVPLTGISFVHNLENDNGYNLSASGPVSGTCGGTNTITSTPSSDGEFDDTSIITISGASIPANSSCTFVYDVTPSRDATLPADDTQLGHSISASRITTNEGATNASFSHAVRTQTGIEVVKTFDGASSGTLNTNTASGADLSIEITNYNGVEISNFDLTDLLPAGLDATNIFRNTCGGTTSIGGGDEVSVTGASLNAVSASPISGTQTAVCNIDARIEPETTANQTYTNEIPAGTLGGYQFNSTTATLTVTDVIPPENPLTVSKSFQRGNIYPGEYQNLTFTFENTYDEVITNIDLLDDLVANMTSGADLRVGSAGVVSNGCNGTATAVPNSTIIRVDDASLQVGQSCTVTVQITQASDAADNRNITNTIPTSQITFDLIDQTGVEVLNAPSSTLRVRRPVDLFKSYSPESVPEGGESRLALTFTRRSRVGATTNSIAFVDNLPSGHVIAPVPNVLNECGGTVTASSGGTSVSLSGGSLGPVPSESLSCSVVVSIVAPSSPGSATNTVGSGDTTALDGGQPSGLNALTTTRSRSATLTRTETELTMTKAFLTPTIRAAEKSRVRITIANTDTDATDLNGVALTDDFGGTTLRLADDIAPTFSDTSGSPNANGCSGGRFSFVTGNGGSITLSDAAIDAGRTCHFEFNTTSFTGGNVQNRIEAGDLISDQGTSNPSAVVATLTVERELNVSKGFSPNVIEPGGSAVLTISIANDTLTNIDGSSNSGNPTLVDTLPANLVVTNGTEATTCTGGTVSLSAGLDEITLSGGTFPAESNCTVTATVTATAAGSYTNVIASGAMVTDTGSTNSSEAQGSVAALDAPTIAKSFSPAAIDAGETSTITFTLSNPNSSAVLPAGLTNAGFSDTLSNMVIASPPGVGGTCTGLSYSASAGGGSFVASDIAIPPASSCTVTLDVTSSTAGSHPNQATGVTTDQTPTAGAPSGTVNLSVTGSSPVTISKTFVDSAVETNTATTMLIELINPNAFEVDIDPTGFTDTFPTSPGAMVVGAAPNVFTTCSGTVEDLSGGSVTAGDAGIQLKGGFVPANSTCYVSVDVEMPVQGTYTNTTSNLETATGTGSAASDDIVVSNTLTITSGVEANRNVRASDNDFLVNSVLGASDTIAGNPATVGPGAAGSVDLKVISASDPAITVGTDTGIIQIAGGTPPGTYTVTYEICQPDGSPPCAAQRTETVILADAVITTATTYTSGSPLVVMQNDFNQEPGNVLGPGDELDGIQATVGPGTGGNVDLTINSITGPGVNAISVNLNTGIITVNSGAADGLYEIQYVICEDDNADNCSSITSEFVEVRVTPIAASAEAQRDLTGSDDPISAGNLLGVGDTLDSALATVGSGANGNVDLQVVSIEKDGIASTLVAVNLDTGEIVVSPGAPDGTYTVEYVICEEANRGNCATATEMIVITSNPLTAGSEATRNVTGSDGAVSAGSVLDAVNDTVDGAAATVGNGSNAALSVVAGADTDPELALDTATGALTVAAGTPAGTYTLRYRLCEADNTDNCAEAVETVAVTDTPIAAGAEADRPIRQQNAPATAGSVIGGDDLVNSVQAVPGFGGNVILRVVTADPGLSLDPETGVISVAGDTAIGSPTITYRLCEPSNLDNCATATETVVITQTPIATAAEADRPINQTNASQSAGTVLGAGDTLDGAQATLGGSGNVTVSRLAGDPELTLNSSTGDIIVAGDTPVGTYTITYRMCEAANSFNCSDATETVAVSRNPIAASAEANRELTGSDAALGAGSVIGSGDTLGGAQATIDGNVTLSVVAGANTDGELSLDTATGILSAAPGTLAGTYTLEYQICEAANTNNCTSAIETVVVTDTPIEAVSEADRNVAQNNSAVTAGNVLGAGDQIGGSGAVAESSGNIVLSLVTADAGLSLDTDTGIITVAADTAEGTYTLTYSICEPSNSDNCDTATETIVVARTSIQAIDETARALIGNDVAQSAGNVVGASDQLNGTQAVVGTGGNVVLYVVAGADTSAELSLDTHTGEITLAAGATVGSYTIRYRICEATNLANCAEAVETVNVSDTVIVAGAEADRMLVGSDLAQSAGNVLDAANDQLGSAAAVPGTGGNVVLSAVTGPFTSPGLTLNTETGELTASAGLAAGTYTLQYEICEASNSDNCTDAVETVVVTDTSITAGAEADRELRSQDTAQNAGSVIDAANDMVGGAAAVPGSSGNVTLTLVTGPSTSPDLSLDTATGIITVAADTPPGNYTLEYEICEVGNSDNCIRAIESVVVSLTPLVAAAEATRQLRSTDAAQTAGNVLDPAADLLDGGAAIPGPGGNVVLSAVAGASTSPELSIDPDTGELRVAADTPPGVYTLEYQICEAANLDNCATAIETVEITLTPITTGAEPTRELFSTDGAQDAGTVFGAVNDTLDGSPAIPGSGGNVVLSQLGTGSTELSLDPNTGIITVATDTPAGTYTIDYQICEAVNLDNCSNATETVEIALTLIEASGGSHGPFDIAAGGSTPSVLADDLIEGATPTAGPGGTVVISLPSGSPDPGITMDFDTGIISIAIGTPPGIHQVEYQICEAVNLDNCVTAIEEITVVAIEANSEAFAPFATNGGTTTSVLASDFVGGVPATLSTVTMSVLSADAGVTLDTATGFITLAPDQPAGSYVVVYEICSVAFPTSCEQATETVVQLARPGIETTKTLVLEDNGDGIDGVGDRLRFTITVENTGNTPLSGVAVTDRMEDLSGTVRALDADPEFVSADMSSAEGNLVIGETAEYSASFTLDVPAVSAGGISNVATSRAMPVHAADVPGIPSPLSDVSDDGVDGDGNTADDPTVLAIASSLDATGLTVVKTTPRGQVERGTVVPYTITVENENVVVSGQLDIVDILPAGFLYQPGSARLDGAAVIPEVAGRRITIPDVPVPPLSTVMLTLSARITSGVEAGTHVNTAQVVNPLTGTLMAVPDTAIIQIVPEPVFDCGDVIGKVFDDQNSDGYQNTGEPGLAAVRIAGVDGTIITTDQHGRYHVPCAALPSNRGSNFILKLDTRTLPSGYRVTTENPRVVRLTRGKVSKINFGAAMTRVVRVDLNAAAFDGSDLSAQLISGLDRLVGHIADRPSTVRVSFRLPSDATGRHERQARHRLNQVERHLRRRWQGVGRYRLTVEKTLLKSN